jgi:hypothetical protein
VLDGISGDPNVFQIAQGQLIGAVLGEDRKMGVVHESNRPEFCDGFCDFTALFVRRRHLGLAETVCGAQL